MEDFIDKRLPSPTLRNLCLDFGLARRTRTSLSDALLVNTSFSQAVCDLGWNLGLFVFVLLFRIPLPKKPIVLLY